MDALKTFFANNQNILLGYLFGSRASGKIGPLSDYDIGILTKDEISFDEKYFIEVDLRKILDTTSLDLIIMNKAP